MNAMRFCQKRNLGAPDDGSVPQKTENPPQREEIERRRKDVGSKKNSEPNGSDASIDVKAIVFGQCLSWVAEKSGKAPSGLRPLFGRWCRDFGDAAVVDAVAAAQREGPVEPVAWISGKLAAGAKPKPGRPIGGFIPMHPGAGG